MTSTGNAPLAGVLRDAARILDAMDSTPIAGMDALFYAHYAEELRLIVEEIITTHRRAGGAPPARVWLLWDCADPIGIFDSEHDARQAQADLQHRLLCEFGPDPDLLETIAVTTAMVQTSWPAPEPARP